MHGAYQKARKETVSVGLDSWEKAWELYRYDLVGFCRFMGVEPSSDQILFLLHVQYVTLYGKNSKRVIAKSGQGCGKTIILCIVILWRTLRVPGTISVITAPTADQCRDVFFSELQRVVSAGPRVIRELIKIDAGQAFIKHRKYGRAWRILSRTASRPDCMRGLHHPNMTILCEEMSGIEIGIMEVLVGTCSQADNLLLGIGNPSQREGYFFKAFCDSKTAQNWPRRMTFDREKLSIERPDVCDPSVITALENEWGRDSDMFRVAVLGEFPSLAGNTVLPYDWVVRAAKTKPHRATQPSDLRTISTDFARFGGDETVTYMRMGNAIIDSRIARGIEPTQAAREAIYLADELGWDKESVVFVPDSTGMGQGALGIYYESDRRVFEWHNAGKPRKSPRKWANLISRAWIEFRELLYAQSQGKVFVSIPNDELLINQLTSMRYEFDEQNRIKVWNKDKYVKETGLSSPDRAEALVMGFCKAPLTLSRGVAA